MRLPVALRDFFRVSEISLGIDWNDLNVCGHNGRLSDEDGFPFGFLGLQEIRIKITEWSDSFPGE
jgi:hypothetical protein